MNANSAPDTVNNTMSAGCSKFPAVNNSAIGSEQSLPHSSSSNNQQQMVDNAFPSPPQSTSTSSQPNSSTNLIQSTRPKIPQSKSAINNSNLTNNSRQSSGGFFNFFRGRKSDDSQNIQNFISNEGSITSAAWQAMSKQSNIKTRLRALETLSMISRQRKLQVSTLEGIWTELQDLLNDPIAHQPFLNLIYTITVSQITEIGLALRLTFFETIRSIGLTEITIKWLTALSNHGQNVEPFEMSIAELLADWLEKIVLGNDSNISVLATDVIQLCTSLICHQSSVVDEETLSRMIRCCCKRIVRGPGDQLGMCLTLLEAIFENCVILKSELFLLVTTLCFIVCLEVEADKTWHLFSTLLTSEHSYEVLRLLEQIMRTFVSNSNEDQHEISVQIARGSVHAMAQALFGVKRIQSLNSSPCPCVIMTAFEEAMFSDVLVARQVIHSIRRLVVKHGKTLQLFNWTSVIKLLRSAIMLCSEDVEVAVVIRHELHSILSLIESLIDRNEFTGSTEGFYSIIEECVIDRPDCSALRLMEYRLGQLTPEHENWIEKVHRLLTKFMYEGVSLIRREKAIYAMHNIYKKYRILHEEAILRKIVLSICSTIPTERESSVQYYLICVLFDVAKTVKINIGGSNDLFMKVLDVIGSTFNNGINFENDNLEVSACLLGELLDERWPVFDLEMVQTIFNIMIKHLELQYVKINGSIISGCEVRMRLFESLLLLQSHPLNGQIARVLIVTPTQFKPIYNPRIIRAGEDTQGQFQWTSICEITTLGLQTEIHWPALERILEFLSGSLEHRFLVYTAGENQVNKLVNAILNVAEKVEERYPLLSKATFARYLCPVLGKLINYTNGNHICKTIVALIRSGCPQAIMSCTTAIQVHPNQMAVFNRSLLENLASLKPQTQFAIPIIELLGDAVELIEFYEFFQEKHFKIVINLLAPYSNARQYNSFIVTSVYQTAMKWFLCVPLEIRGQIAAHMFGSFAKHNNLFPRKSCSSESPESLVNSGGERHLMKSVPSNTTIDRLPEVDSHPTALIITPSKKRSNIKKPSTIQQEQQNSFEKELDSATAIGELYLQSLSDSPQALERNPSGDGRQLLDFPFDDPNPLFSTGDTVSMETDSIGDFKGVSELAQQILTQEYANQQQDMKQNRPRESFATNLTMEWLENLNYFIRFFRTKNMDSILMEPSNKHQTSDINDSLVEKSVETWVVDGTVLTLRVFVKPEPLNFGLHSRRIATISVDRPSSSSGDNEIVSKAGRAALAIQANNNRMNRSMSRDKKRTITIIGTPKARNTSVTSKESDDHLLRRRHQSTKVSISSSASPQKSIMHPKDTSQSPDQQIQSPGQATPDSDEVFLGGDNMDLSAGNSPEWIQLVIRHVFGKESYIMRSFVDIPLGFDSTLGCANSDPTSLLLHLRGNHSAAVHLQQKDNDLIARSLRFLDGMPNEELHEVTVIYMHQPHNNLNDLLFTENGSQRFTEFVQLLGKPCPNTNKNGRFDLCYEHLDLMQRIKFHITTVVSCSDEMECQTRKKLIENSQICVVFNESGCKLGPLFRSDQVTLEVIPQDQATVTINMHARKEIACWMAMSRGLLPDCQASQVIRKMVIRAQRSLKSNTMNEEKSDNLPYLSCAVDRQRHIHKLRKRGVAESF